MAWRSVLEAFGVAADKPDYDHDKWEERLAQNKKSSEGVIGKTSKAIHLLTNASETQVLRIKEFEAEMQKQQQLTEKRYAEMSRLKEQLKSDQQGSKKTASAMLALINQIEELERQLQEARTKHSSLQNGRKDIRAALQAAVKPWQVSKATVAVQKTHLGKLRAVEETTSRELREILELNSTVKSSLASLESRIPTLRKSFRR